MDFLLHCLSGETIALLIALPLLAWFLCRWLFEKDTELENRKRAAGLLASKLTSMGLVRTPKLLTDYSISDIPSLISDVEDLFNLFLDPNNEDALLKEISGTFKNVLAVQVTTPDGLAMVQAALATVAPAAPAPANTPATAA